SADTTPNEARRGRPRKVRRVRGREPGASRRGGSGRYRIPSFVRHRSPLRRGGGGPVSGWPASGVGVRVEAVTVRVVLNGTAVPVKLEREALATIAAALPDRDGSPWLAGAQAAADYLGGSPQRGYKSVQLLPHCQDSAL